MLSPDRRRLSLFANSMIGERSKTVRGDAVRRFPSTAVPAVRGPRNAFFAFWEPSTTGILPVGVRDSWAGRPCYWLKAKNTGGLGAEPLKSRGVDAWVENPPCKRLTIGPIKRTGAQVAGGTVPINRGPGHERDLRYCSRSECERFGRDYILTKRAHNAILHVYIQGGMFDMGSRRVDRRVIV
jgi:hypothetical protein